jgi:hypothetical protein
VRTPDEGVIAFVDLVRGEVAFEWRDIPDFVILRADGTPTYQLANAVDDLAMGINLIARGEDLLSATPRQLLMYTLLRARATSSRSSTGARRALLPGAAAGARRPPGSPTCRCSSARTASR